MELGGKIGRLPAHHLVEGACRRAVAEGTTLREALGATLAEDAAHAELMDAAALDRVCDPANYAGQAAGFADAVLAAWRQEAGQHGSPSGTPVTSA
ncbi:3-carboxy-cis,cis-muconate cycloisomerase [Cupriavidus basilensis OR16]|uniref:3-carboxy-cis,cis-muconate cycloisomerase n=1 Tax=Cupriavidus basilensis OR16 TaxID=1127483 RepID=H1SIW2_9BURK|nr:3-carboxy-cis,cis-muconate cycloisomerase [Cupriavidus basilensis OR16]